MAFYFNTPNRMPTHPATKMTALPDLSVTSSDKPPAN